MNIKDSKYGFGENPPYSLYQNEDGKWGLVDGNGNILPADFDRIDEYRFSCAFWEVVTFDENEGFELLAWYDLCVVWFNFTWDDPAYPEEFAGYLWKKSEKEIGEYADIVLRLMSNENIWLLQAIIENHRLSNSNDDEEYDLWYENLIASHPEVKVASTTNKMIDFIMRDNTIDQDLRCALWHAKVQLDYDLQDF